MLLQPHERGLEIAAAIEQRNTPHCGYDSDGTSHHEAIDLINSPVINSVVLRASVSRLSSGTYSGTAPKKAKTWHQTKIILSRGHNPPGTIYICGLHYLNVCHVYF